MNTRRIVASVGLTLALASTCGADIFLFAGSETSLGDSGLVQLQVTLESDDGKLISVIVDPEIRGAHHVTFPNMSGIPGQGAPAPTSKDHGATFPTEWVAYDSYVKLPDQPAGPLGILSETPVTGSTDDLGLSRFEGEYPGDAGFGAIRSDADSGRWGFGFRTQDRSESYDFLQLVTMYEGDALFLDVTVDVITVDEFDQQYPFRCEGGGRCREYVEPVLDDKIIEDVDNTTTAPIITSLDVVAGDASRATWSFFRPVEFTPDPRYDGPLTGPVLPASIDPISGEVTWNPAGSPLGTYDWGVAAADGLGGDSASLTVVVSIPEPGALALAGFVLVGAVAAVRTRRADL